MVAFEFGHKIELYLLTPCHVFILMHVHLFVEILNQYLYYFERGNPSITPNYIQGLIALINDHIDNMEEGEQRTEVEAFYQNTLQHIRAAKAKDELAERFAEVTV